MQSVFEVGQASPSMSHHEDLVSFTDVVAAQLPGHERVQLGVLVRRPRDHLLLALQDQQQRVVGLPVGRALN